MNKFLLVVVMAFLAASVVGLQAADITPFLKVTNYTSHMKTATANLEKIFMNDQIEFTGEARKIYIEAWKTCQSRTSYPTGSGSLAYMASSNTRDALNKAVEALDTLVYDQLVKFKNPEAKQLYREALKRMRLAAECL
ncbi:MAG TPA: hypothetical protein PKO06_00725 [Candidatus Ozemobacteraceae bacterium]|nr:hypothetical protein [Candidatus Ozemobacteraceae bacterium]